MKTKLGWKREFFALAALFLLCAAPAFTQEQSSAGPSPEQFSRVISLDWPLERLAASVKEGKVEQIPKDKFLLIEGIVSSRQVVQPEKENYFAVLELSSADWSGGGRELAMYRCYFRLEGSEFSGLVSPGRGKGGPEEIPLHAHVLAIGTYLGYGQDNQGNRFPVLKALRIKELRQ